MYRSFVSLVRIRVACRRGRRCGRQGLPRFRLRRYEIIRNLRMPDRARSAFLLKNLKYLGRVRFDPVRTGPGGVCRREGYGLCRFGCFAPFVSGAACRFSRPSSGGGTGSTVRTVRGEAPIRSFRSWPAEPPLCDRSLAVKKRTVLRTVAGRIKKSSRRGKSGLIYAILS